MSLYSSQAHKTPALDDAEKIAWLRLFRTENVGPITFYQLVENFGSAQKAIEALPSLARRGGRLKNISVYNSGAAIAAQVCAQCHNIGLGQAAAVDIGAPDFRKIAGRSESTPEGLEAWMRSTHPKMPNYVFLGPDVADLAAFIVSLRKTPG